MEKKRILIMCNMDNTLYIYRRETVIRLLKEGYDVYVTFPYGDKVEYFKKLGCKYIETKVDRRGVNIFNDLILLKQYISLIKKIKPSCVLTYTIKSNVYGGIAAALNKVQYIANITGLGSAVENGGIMQKITIFLYKIAFRKIKTIFFQNTENMQLFKDKKIAKKAKYRLIPGSGVNLELFKVSEYPEESQPLEFLYMGRVMKEKGVDQYIETAEYIKKKYPDAKFHIIGYCEEAYEERLNKLQELGIIEYHGMQDDVRPFVKRSWCTIHPTYYPEGMSNVLLESAASGRPIITTNRPGCKEIVDDGVNGFLVEAKNTKDLINIVEKFINMPHEEKIKMGLAGRAKVEKTFDRNIVVEAYLEEIERELGHRECIEFAS